MNQITHKHDIVITLPKTIKWDEYQKELDAVADKKQVMRFKVSKLPTQTAIGKKCYLCYSNNIIGWMEITGLTTDNFKCTTTGKHWSGNFIERAGKFHEIKPVPMKGFRGFKYITPRDLEHE